MTNSDILIAIGIGILLIACKAYLDKRHAKRMKIKHDISIHEQIADAREWNQRQVQPTSKRCKCGNYAPIGRIYGDSCIECMPLAMRPVKKRRVVPAIAKPKEIS